MRRTRLKSNKNFSSQKKSLTKVHDLVFTTVENWSKVIRFFWILSQNVATMTGFRMSPTNLGESLSFVAIIRKNRYFDQKMAKIDLRFPRLPPEPFAPRICSDLLVTVIKKSLLTCPHKMRPHGQESNRGNTHGSRFTKINRKMNDVRSPVWSDAQGIFLK